MADIEKMTPSEAAREAAAILSDGAVRTLIIPLRDGRYAWEIWRMDPVYQRVWNLNSSGSWNPQDPRYMQTEWWQTRSRTSPPFVASGEAPTEQLAHEAIRTFLTQRLAKLRDLGE